MRQLIKFSARWEYNDKENKKVCESKGREFTDIPATVAIVGDGIYNGVYFPAEELKKSLQKWDGKPLCLDHSDSILHEIGYISNPRLVDDKKLVVDPHIADYTKYSKDALAWIRLRREAGQVPEVSISAWVDIELEEVEGYNEKLRVARNIEPVHLALVTEGACSPEAGCGIGISYSEDDNPWDVKTSQDNDSVTFSPADVPVYYAPSNFYEGDDMKEKKDFGVVPPNPKNYGKDATGSWSKPRLSDFTNKSWDELTDREKRAIASCFAWSPKMPPERFTDLKLPHHDPKTKNVVWRGVVSAMAVLFGARGGVDIPSEDRKKVYNHLAKHYRDFDKEPPEFHALEEGGVEMAEKLLKELEEEEKTTTEEEEVVEEEKVENEESSEVVELRKKIDEYEKAIEECRKAREELEKKVLNLSMELDQIKEEKKKLEEMRGKPKVAVEESESKELIDEYERLKKLMKKL